MDALKAEIALKRKTLDVPVPDGARPNKYMRRGDLERLKEEQERKEKEEREEKEREREEHLEDKVCTVPSMFVHNLEDACVEESRRRASIPA